VTFARSVQWASAAALAIVAAASGESRALFVDVAAKAGLTGVSFCGSDTNKKYILESIGNGVALIDYNNDGLLDAFFVTASRLEGFANGQTPTHRLYRNRGDGSFADVTRQAGLDGSGWGQGVCAGDYDNDGYTDLLVTYYGGNRLYRNSPEGRFQEVATQAGLPRTMRWSTGCAFVDYDRDGRLDLFIANYIVFDKAAIPLPGTSPNCKWKGVDVLCGPMGLPGETNQLFHNEGNGRFREVSESSGIAAVKDRYSLSVTPLDFDRDGWTDIYVAVDSKASILYRNNRNGTFTDVAVEAGAAYREDGREQAGMGSAAGDMDGDGHLDIVKTNFIDDTPNIYRNLGDGAFEDMVHSSGAGRNTMFMGWGTVFFDFDNDRRPDIFMVNGHVYPELEARLPDQPYRQRSILYRNVDGKRFEDVSAQGGPAVLARHAGRGLAAGDFDNDGFVDLFLNNMNEPPSLLRNSGAAAAGTANFLSLRLVGVKSNRSAIGARVTVSAGGRSQVQEVRSGSSFLSQSDLRLHFGLGPATAADRIEIQWPYAGSRDVIGGVKAGQFLTVVEGRGIVEP